MLSPSPRHRSNPLQREFLMLLYLSAYLCVGGQLNRLSPRLSHPCADARHLASLDYGGKFTWTRLATNASENSNAYQRKHWLHFLCKHIGSVENCFFPGLLCITVWAYAEPNRRSSARGSSDSFCFNGRMMDSLCSILLSPRSR